MSARVTSALWVSAYVRRVFVQGAFAATMRRGAEEAGTIFVLIDRLDGTVDLYGPAPQTAFDDERPRDRLFMIMEQAVERPAALDRLDKEMRFDPDMWLIEVEDREGRAFLETIDPARL